MFDLIIIAFGISAVIFGAAIGMNLMEYLFIHWTNDILKEKGLHYKIVANWKGVKFVDSENGC
jgi:hypothetical protein